MTKFQELQEAYRRGQLNADEDRKDSYAFGSECVDECRLLLECSGEDLYVFPVADRQIGNEYNTVGATRRGDDGFWQFGLGLRLQPTKHVLIFVHLRRRGDSWVYRFGPNGKETAVSRIQPGASKAVAAAICAYVRECLNPEFLTGPAQIGFRVEDRG